MKVFPAVDILGGNCVQLVQGKRENATVFGSPLGNAVRWIDQGAENLHIVNLDGAFDGSSANADLIKEIIRETGVFLQLGGGIRSINDARAWLETGVDRVIIGTFAIEHPEAVTELSDEFGAERIVAGVDAKNGQVVVRGWKESCGDYIEWARRFEECGAGALLFTNVDVEGLQSGIKTEPVEKLVRSVNLPVIAAGGISSRSDAEALKKIGADGIVLGSSLYSGKIKFSEILEVCR